MENKTKICIYCKYEWKSRKDKPKECPRCKHRFDSPYINKKVLKHTFHDKSRKGVKNE
jgi:hypothetical protein